MITLITGNPGAGKTLYCVSNLLRELCGSEIKSTNESGQTVVTPRVVYSNIPGLLLEHEVIDGSDSGGLNNWHEWAKPGAVVCYDEVQREWKPRPNGSKVPKCIEMLETHRHMGVDFILLTQHPGLLDQNIRALVGRHLHVRRFGGVGAAIVYEWDHCSRSLLYSKALSKSTFRYSKDVFKLYKSAELHTKPKTTIPTLAFVVVGALVAAAAAIPYAASRVADKSEQAKASADKKAAPSPAVPGVERLPSPSPVPESVRVSNKPPETLFIEPDPPYPLDSLVLVGSFTARGQTSFMIKNGASTVPHQILEKSGYAFSSVGECAVKVTFYSRSAILTCPDFAAPAVTPRPVAPSKVPPTLQHASYLAHGETSRPWSNDGLVIARGGRP